MSTHPCIPDHTHLMRTSVGHLVHVPSERGRGTPALASTTLLLPLDWSPAITSVGTCAASGGRRRGQEGQQLLLYGIGSHPRGIA